MIYFNLKILIFCVVVLCCVVTTSMIRKNMYDIKILWLVGLIFELRIGLVFQYTKLQLRSWCTKYICILTTIFTTHVQKRFTFFTCCNHIFLPNFTKSYFTMQIVDNKFILHPKSITVLVCCQIFVVKGCFFIIR